MFKDIQLRILQRKRGNRSFGFMRSYDEVKALFDQAAEQTDRHLSILAEADKKYFQRRGSLQYNKSILIIFKNLCRQKKQYTVI